MLTVLPTLCSPVPHLERIVNGYIVDITDVPYQAALRRKMISGWVHSCGAVVISDRSVLTAAHCVNTYDEQQIYNLQVTVGTTNRLTGGTAYEVSKVNVHEQYSSETLENDIAVVTVHDTIIFSDSVNKVNLPGPEFNIEKSFPKRNVQEHTEASLQYIPG
ncbi:unnamed protein product [Leptidea sinapis]|uniref:Peptidase S1 domain-containing protein n=1 Tax=Leptidea sinapis TaxID=189913 RepID=A0A5E4PT81_9NEOP|nr:unnamed protein product [Leptidea sinapis]